MLGKEARSTRFVMRWKTSVRGQSDFKTIRLESVWCLKQLSRAPALYRKRLPFGDMIAYADLVSLDKYQSSICFLGNVDRMCATVYGDCLA